MFIPYMNGPWTPSQITTILWLDASDATTIVEADVPGSVSTWEDKSNSVPKNDATQGVIGNQPAYSSINKTISFDGISDYMTTNNAIDDSIVNIFLVRKSSAQFTVDIAGDGGDKLGYVYSFNDANTVLYSGFGTPSLYADGTLESPVNRGDLFTLFNDNTFHINEYINCDMSTWTQFNLCNYFNGTVYTQAIYSEIIITTGTLSTETRQKIEGYLQAKWNTPELP